MLGLLESPAPPGQCQQSAGSSEVNKCGVWVPFDFDLLVLNLLLQILLCFVAKTFSQIPSTYFRIANSKLGIAMTLIFEPR